MILYTDGGYRPSTGAYGSFRIENDKGQLWELLRMDLNPRKHYDGAKTNNQAEYCILFEALLYCLSRNFKSLKVYSDSQLMVKQLNKEYAIKNEILARWAANIWDIWEDFDNIELEHVPREVLVEKVGH
jgi:ribonuclease HI